MQTPTFEQYEDAEKKWLEYPSSREFHTSLCEFIIKNSPLKSKLEYMGAYYITPTKSYVQHLISPKEKKYNLDIIYTNSTAKYKPSKYFGNTQSSFSSLKQFAEIRTPKPGKIGVYFFGEIHEADGFVHWNVGFLDTEKLVFFDPIIDPDILAYVENGVIPYEFNSRDEIAAAFNTKTCIFLPVKRPQWVPYDKYFIDTFCQSWVILFLDIYANNLTHEFLMLDFEKYQTDILKSWLVCTINTLKKYDVGWDIIKDELESFPYCLTGYEKGKKCVPTITKLTCSNKKDTKCAKMIVETFDKVPKEFFSKTSICHSIQ